MDVSSLVSGTGSMEMIQQLTGLAKASDVVGADVALLDQVLELQQQVAAQLLQTMGVGGNLDLLA